MPSKLLGSGEREEADGFELVEHTEEEGARLGRRRAQRHGELSRMVRACRPAEPRRIEARSYAHQYEMIGSALASSLARCRKAVMGRSSAGGVSMVNERVHKEVDDDRHVALSTCVVC